MKKIGIIAGEKNLPIEIINWGERNEIDVYVIGIKGSVSKKVSQNKKIKKYKELYITELNKAIKFFKENKVKNIVLIGGVNKAKFKLTLDVIKIAMKLLFKKNKYDGILRLVIEEIEKNDLKVIGIDEILKENIITKGTLTKCAPTLKEIEEIKKNWNEAIQFAKTDKGQSVIIFRNKIIAKETFKGTDELIERAKEIKNNEIGGILLKVLKPSQERRADLPVIGVKTIKQLKSGNFSGIAIESNNAIFENKEETLKKANEEKIFIIGM